MRHYKRKTEPVPAPECPLYVETCPSSTRVLCEAEPPAARSALIFRSGGELVAWTRTHCKNFPGYRDCWIYRETERRYEDDI